MLLFCNIQVCNAIYNLNRYDSLTIFSLVVSTMLPCLNVVLLWLWATHVFLPQCQPTFFKPVIGLTVGVITGRVPSRAPFQGRKMAPEGSIMLKAPGTRCRKAFC